MAATAMASLARNGRDMYVLQVSTDGAVASVPEPVPVLLWLAGAPGLAARFKRSSPQ